MIASISATGFHNRSLGAVQWQCGIVVAFALLLKSDAEWNSSPNSLIPVVSQAHADNHCVPPARRRLVCNHWIISLTDDHQSRRCVDRNGKDYANASYAMQQVRQLPLRNGMIDCRTEERRRKQDQRAVRPILPQQVRRSSSLLGIIVGSACV